MTGQFLATLSPESFLSGLGVGLLGLILAFVGRNWLTSRAGRDDRPVGRGAGPVDRAAHSEASEARRRREEADDAATEEILNRPHTDDPVADLRDRLDRGAGNGDKRRPQ